MPVRADRPYWMRLVVAAAVVVVGGCTLGPEPERPKTSADGAAGYVSAVGSVAEAAEPGPDTLWWQRFGDPATADLVRLAMESNTDLRVAAARVLEAEALFGAAGGARLPQVGYGGSATRQRSSFVLPQVGRITPESTTYGYDLNVSWQADLFGKLKRNQQAAWASLLAEEASRDAVLHSVVAGVVRARVLVATTERALAIARGIRSSWESTLATVERRYRNGLVTAVDLYLARENLSSARAAEVAIEGQLEIARHALDVIVGRRPGTGAVPPDTLSDLPSLEPVPLGLPAELLDRRPDLRQAEFRLAVATYGIGVALADLYPSLTLTASGGGRSDTLGELTSSDSLIYNAVASLVGPLFAGGQRRAGVDAARARAEGAAASYAGAVLRALREVEDALVREQSTRDQLEFSQRRVSEARAADRLARDRYRRGVAPLLTVLETERRLRAAEQALITTKAELWSARIDLFLALGGDWEPAGSTGREGEPEVVVSTGRAEAADALRMGVADPHVESHSRVQIPTQPTRPGLQIPPTRPMQGGAVLDYAGVGEDLQPAICNLQPKNGVS